MSLWHLRRLRAMSWAERRMRVERRLRDRRHRRILARGGPEAVTGPPPSPERFLAEWTESPWILRVDRLAELARQWPSEWTTRTRLEADGILAGRYRWLGAEHELGRRPSWRHEAVSGVDFPTKHWSELSTSSPEGRFDIKHLWEPNLHPAFATLAKAYLLTGHTAYRDHLQFLWRDWMDQNPPLCGPNYLTPVEIGLRLLNWGAALRFWGAAEAPPRDLLVEIFRHTFFQRFTIDQNLSRHSSANNHLLGELTSLVLVDAAFPGLAPTEATAARERELREQVLAQFHEDGGNREQAFHYHAFSLAWALAAMQLARDAGRPWQEPEMDRLRRAAGFLDGGLDRRGEPFLFGDTDESEVLPLAEEPRSIYLPILEHGRALLEGPAAGSVEHERTAWLLGRAPSLKESTTMPERASVVFPQSGHAFLRRGPLEVHVNAGELGYLSIAAHAHADALSVEIRCDGEPILVDPGTYTYRGGDPWREWLVGTPAHPTVTVDGVNQAERLGPFLWGRRYGVLLQAHPPFAATAEHDGYRHLGVIHRRTVTMETSTSVVVDDALIGTGTHHVRVNWPLGPGAVRAEDGRAVLELAAWTVALTVEGLPGTPTLQRGNVEEPGSPCVSPGYDRLVAGTAWTWEGRMKLPARWRTRFEIVRRP